MIARAVFCAESTGKATVSYTSTIAQTFQLKATLPNGNSANAASMFIADPTTAVITTITIPVNQAHADGAEQNQVSVKVVDAKGNPLEGQTVTWVASSTDVTIPPTSSTDIAGVSTVNLTSTAPGLFTLTAQLANGNLKSIQSTFIIAAQITPENIKITSDNALADGNATNSIQVKVTDGHNAPVQGQTVNFTATKTVSGGGEVSFTAQGSSETVTVTANPKSGVGPGYKYQFAVSTWFVQGVNDLIDRADTIAACDAKALPIPTLREVTSAAAPQGSGPRLPRGALIDEWGRLANYGTAIFYNWIYVQEASTNVRSDDGYYRTDDSGNSLSRPVCVVHF